MVLDTLWKKLIDNISIVTLFMIALIIIVWQDYEALKLLIPVHSKPIVSFVFVCMGAMYESVISCTTKNSLKLEAEVNRLSIEIKDQRRQLEVQSVKDSINAMYARFKASGDEWITNNSEVKELAELTDRREKMQINSYTQEREKFLNSKVRR